MPLTPKDECPYRDQERQYAWHAGYDAFIRGINMEHGVRLCIHWRAKLAFRQGWQWAEANKDAS